MVPFQLLKDKFQKVNKHNKKDLLIKQLLYFRYIRRSFPYQSIELANSTCALNPIKFQNVYREQYYIPFQCDQIICKYWNNKKCKSTLTPQIQ